MNNSLLGMARLVALVCLAACTGVAQQNVTVPAAAVGPSAVPSLINYNGVLTRANSAASSGVMGLTFLLYREQEGGAPLWVETQNVLPDKTGHYTVMLGSTKSTGLPSDIFVAGEARWLCVQVAGQAEQPRVLLVAVPYALKAGDAETIGGLPASAFMLATSRAADTAAAFADQRALPPLTVPSSSANVTTAGGAVNALPLWTTSTNIQSSAISQAGTGATAKIGIGTTAPVSTLDIKGGETVRGNLSLPAIGNATATAGKNSQPVTLTASAFNSTTGTAVPKNFRWQVEPANNNSSSASGTLNLLYGTGSNPFIETGLRVGSSGKITFSSGQTFPGTVGSVALTAPASDFTVVGSPVTTKGTLALQWRVPPSSANLANAIVKRDITGSAKIGFLTVTSVSASSSQFATINSAATGNNGTAIYADASNSTGDGPAIWGVANSIGTGVFAYGRTGVHATGVVAGVAADSESGQALVASNGSTDDTVVISNNGGGFPIYVAGTGGGVYIDSTGSLYAQGSINGSSKNFRIDHPLDPANKFLYHASVESSEMMNIYTGNVTTDSQGSAVVDLPEWFEALNGDFRYQLTVIGQFAQAIVEREIQDHRFSIRTNLPHVKVSWQVTGVRHDAYAQANPIVVERKKDSQEHGFYVHPELYGAPREKGLDSAHSAAMRLLHSH